MSYEIGVQNHEPIRMQVRMRNARLYAFTFAEQE